MVVQVIKSLGVGYVGIPTACMKREATDSWKRVINFGPANSGQIVPHLHGRIEMTGVRGTLGAGMGDESSTTLSMMLATMPAPAVWKGGVEHSVQCPVISNVHAHSTAYGR